MRCVSPWYNRTGWQGVKHRLTYLQVQSGVRINATREITYDRPQGLYFINQASGTGVCVCGGGGGGGGVRARASHYSCLWEREKEKNRLSWTGQRRATQYLTISACHLSRAGLLST